MKRKYWIILIIVALAIGLGLALYFILRPKIYHPEVIDPRTLHACPANKEMLVGLWQIDKHIYYRFNPDGTGHTWDINDDLTEAEATTFQWDAFKEAIMLTYELRIRGIVPRYYELEVLNEYNLRFHDTYTTYTMDRVKEEVVE